MTLQEAFLDTPVRRKVLDELCECDSYIRINALAPKVGLSTTAARYHLRVLERAGMVEWSHRGVMITERGLFWLRNQIAKSGGLLSGRKEMR